MSKKLFLFFISVMGLLPLTAFSNEPTAKEIIEKSLTASGGIEKLEKVQSKTASAKVQVAGLKGTYHMWAVAPDRLKTLLDLKVITQERATDGTKGWQKQTTLQELAGSDLDRMKRSATR